MSGKLGGKVWVDSGEMVGLVELGLIVARTVSLGAAAVGTTFWDGLHALTITQKIPYRQTVKYGLFIDEPLEGKRSMLIRVLPSIACGSDEASLTGCPHNRCIILVPGCDILIVGDV